MFKSAWRPILDASERWAARRRPKGRSVELNQQRIFIFPSVYGWGYLFLCLVLYLIATNYQNNLIHGFAFLLIALGVLTIHYTFLNLSGLTITGVKAYNAYAGEMVEFKLRVHTRNRRRYENVVLRWKGENDSFSLYLDRSEDSGFSLFAHTDSRGPFTPKALLVETYYPFGLLRAWSWIELDLSSVIYPKPLKGRYPMLSNGDAEGELGHQNRGDDFSGLDEYQPGISTRHIAWKQYAQGRGLLIKNYIGQESRQIWLSWDDWPDLDLEHRLSVITYWALHFERESQAYGLKLPGMSIQPSVGPEHLEKLLTVLATFSITGSNS